MFSELFKIHNILSIFLGLAGLAFGIYSFVASQPKYEISYVVRAKTVAEVASFGFSVVDQNSSEVIKDDICRTDISFWVTGNTVIEDRVIRRPLMIVLPEKVRIIRSKILAQIGTSELSLKESDKGIVLKFNYLDPGAGARIAILATCTPASTSMAGSTIGDLSITKKVEEASTLFGPLWVFLAILLGLGAMFPTIKLSDGLDEVIQRKLQNPWVSRISKLTSFVVMVFLSWALVFYVSYIIDQAFVVKVPTTISINDNGF